MKKSRILMSLVLPATKNYVPPLEYFGCEVTAEYAPAFDNSYDALVLCGGGDVDPACYGEEMNGSDEPEIERDKSELALVKAYMEMKKPILGICRGHQVINVALGGTLVQHLDTADNHRDPHSNNDLVHATKADADGFVAKLYGETPFVNSAHHQAIKELGKGLRAVQYSCNDNVIEAVEHESLPIIALQWHPERMSLANRRSDTVDGLPIFEYFVSLINKNS